MTVSSIGSRISYIGNNVTTSFSYPFAVLTTADLYVYVNGVLKTINVDYFAFLNTAVFPASPNGASVSITPALTPSQTLLIICDPDYYQAVDLPINGLLPSSSVERMSDKLTIIAQRLKDLIGRSLHIADSNTTTISTTLPDPQSGYVLGWNPLGTGIINYLVSSAFPTIFPMSVSTVAQLRLTVPLYPNQQFNLLGHTTAGYGGGVFYYAGLVANTSSDNNGTIIVSTVGPNFYQFKRLNVDIITPWMFGATGVAAGDNTAMSNAITVIKSVNRGTLLIPPDISATATVPAPALGNSQSIIIIDRRGDRIGGVQAFGVEEHYIEGKDGGGGLASEFRVSGKQNPGYSLHPRSDGTALGYPYANNMVSIVGFNNAGQNNVQWLVDPYSHGRKGDWAFEQYAAGPFSVSISMYCGVDLNGKSRFDLTPIGFPSIAIAISSITNTSPIVVNTAAPHGIVAQVSPISITGTGNATLDNSSWIAQVTGASQVTLLLSVASGAVGAVGNLNVQKNSQRATLNVPAIQGGSEAIVAEGRIVATGANGILASEAPQGTAPISAQSQTVDVTFHARPYVVNIAGAQVASGTAGSGGCKTVTGSATLSGGTATVTLTNDAVFTTTSTYRVAGCANLTAANACRIQKTANNQITITGTGSDVIEFSLTGF